MYRITAECKRDAQRRWALPDRVFFACGACHILAYAFLERYTEAGFQAIWVKPKPGFTGNHIFVAREHLAFDYHGHMPRAALLEHMARKARRWWPGWDFSLHALPRDVLVSEAKSRRYDGLWLSEPTQFLKDALPRARVFLNRYPAPEMCLSS